MVCGKSLGGNGGLTIQGLKDDGYKAVFLGIGQNTLAYSMFSEVFISSAAEALAHLKVARGIMFLGLHLPVGYYLLNTA